MALSMAAPTAINNPLNRYTYHQDFQNYTPATSASTTPSTVSPTSPRNSSSTSTSPGKFPHGRQLKPPKTPFYVPAVLRPTEHPSRHRTSKSSSSNCVSRVIASSIASPLTPPSSTESSFNSREGQKRMEDTIQQRLMASEGITRVVTDEWSDDVLEQVTGAPTRDHWKPDSSSPTCDSPLCATSFSFLLRRHHCRRCGNIYCFSHSEHSVPLDQHARFHPEGSMARACGNCWNDYTAWKRRRGERGSSSAGSETQVGSGAATPIAASGAHNRSRSAVSAAVGHKQMRDPVCGSVGRDWNWSTF